VSTDELLTELLRRIGGLLDADTAAVLLLDERRERLYPRTRIGSEDGIRSVLTVPLRVGERVVGELRAGARAEREFGDRDRELLALAADRAGSILETTAATLRLDALQRIFDPALAYMTQDDLLPELLQRASEILHSDTAAILLLEPNGEYVRARAAKGIEEEVEQGVRIPVGKGFAGRIAAERRPVAIEDVDHADILNPILREKGIRSLLGVPLLVEGRVLGVLHVGSLVRRTFTADEAELLQFAADRAALAIDYAALYEQRRLSEALQRRLLPEQLAGVPGLELASRYLPASGESLGGDWYDAFMLGGGRIVVAVGDVVGHGLLAASAMAQLRTALRAYAADGHAPAATVERVNRLMWHLGPTAMTTLAYAVVDPVAESLELVNAGHPPPLVIDPAGEPDYLPLQGGLALGASPLATYRSETHPFPTGSTVILYTDGLVESRTQPIDVGLERLRALAREAADLEELCTTVVEQMVPESRPDDIAIAAARIPTAPDTLTARWPAEKDALVGMRQLLRRWLRAQGASEDETFDITVATQEACANAVEHAYSPGRRMFAVEASHRNGLVRVVVRDEGRWRPPRGTNRGRGLPLMRALMQRVDIEHGDAGTVVVLEREIGRAAAA
jgi:serine phosphatase RsbU (regulator of sigma subunit)/anti-sigma regulatory factor (Ser/Thr protein kinase)